MDAKRSKPTNHYERVMPRVFNNSKQKLVKSKTVTRHDSASSHIKSSKNSISNASFKDPNELPIVLNNYEPDECVEKVTRRSYVVKPRRTLKSLDPPDTVLAKQLSAEKTHDRRLAKTPRSAPVLNKNVEKSTDILKRSIVSETRLKELKDEIKCFDESAKLSHMRSKLFQRCGVLLDEYGRVSIDKGVQVAEDRVVSPKSVRRVSGCPGLEGRASVSDTQMRMELFTYPVDRYLVESSERKELESISSEDLWQIEPVIRLEDEAKQRKLHELLKTTTEELKILSSDLQNIHKPSIAIKTDRTPLDEDFNEKIHIEELVTSKFNKTRFINKAKPSSCANNCFQLSAKEPVESKIAPIFKIRHGNNTNLLRKATSHSKTLSKSEIKIIHISPNESECKLIKEEIKTKENSNEYYFKYESKLASQCGNPLSVHKMPQVNIRGECKIQDIFHIEIMPYEDSEQQQRANTATIEFHHKKLGPQYTLSNAKAILTEYDVEPKALRKESAHRKVTKISDRESSESSNRSTETQHLHRFRSVVCQKPCDSKLSPQLPSDKKSKKQVTASSKIKENNNKISIKDAERNNFTNAVYVPYSHLTLGGISLPELKKAMSDIPANNMPLSPILDQILSSREQNVCHETKELSTSEESLLKDVQELKMNIKKTLIGSKKSYDNSVKLNENEDTKDGQVNSSDNDPQYDDDFEDDDIEDSKMSNTESEHTISQRITKPRNLTLRGTIETHEFIPEIKLKDSETQCNPIYKKSLKITQTSPKRLTIQPINNVLWPLSTDPNSEVNKALDLEKEIIKKLILEEYGDVINKGSASASTSTNINRDINKNTVALQKNTQTSPARVKSIMTSPTRYKTRTTSPVAPNLTVDHETSPHTFVDNQNAKETESDIKLNEAVDLGMSLNLSSPKFSLQLPRTSRDVMNNLNKNKGYTETLNSPKVLKYSVKRNNRMHDTSTTTAEVSSSEISSLGEVKHEEFNPFCRKLLSATTWSYSDSSAASTTSVDHSARVKPSKSDGEVTQYCSRADGVFRTGDELKSDGQLQS